MEESLNDFLDNFYDEFEADIDLSAVIENFIPNMPAEKSELDKSLDQVEMDKEYIMTLWKSLIDTIEKNNLQMSPEMEEIKRKCEIYFHQFDNATSELSKKVHEIDTVGGSDAAKIG